MNEPVRDADWYTRRHGEGAPDQRRGGQRDRDRVLYSSAFKRLSGVTQVVAASEGTIFHNRLIHSLKVAQLGRRLAEFLLTQSKEVEKAHAWGGLDPEVVDAAGLAHDLGHPPFGHIAEKALDDLVREGGSDTAADAGNPYGFEGNAQSFRILTKLAAHHEKKYRGLNLTRAALDSVLKYPWGRDLAGGAGSKRYRKYGAYDSEAEDLGFARKYHQDDTPSLEAAIMDFADGLAYSVHDLEDFLRAGLIPLARLITPREWQRFLDQWRRDTNDEFVREMLGKGDVPDVLLDLAVSLDLGEEYSGTLVQRARLRSRTSSLIREFLPEVTIAAPGAEKPLVINDLHEIQMRFLQRLVWYYVIENPRLATQQAGQRRVIEILFDEFFRASEPKKNGQPKNRHILPGSVERDLDDVLKLEGDAQIKARLRLAADAVCSFTDAEAISMSHRLRGTFPGSVMDLVSR
ncbi:MAG TPA: dNTP triphosphohydrolase [Longimicrobium sp.]|nr:dNTP triphosphohydrolase [Longimicrobium sp.]